MKMRSATVVRTLLLLTLFGLALTLASLPKRSATSAEAQVVTPDGPVTELAIDDGTTVCVAGPSAANKGQPGFGWVNRLTPPSYPATLRAISIAFNRSEIGVDPGDPYRIVVFRDPENDGPENGQQPDVSFIGRAQGTDQFVTFNLIGPITITSGSFVVGALDEFGIADFPAPFDVPGLSTPPGSASFVTSNGGQSWFSLAENPIQGPPGSGCTGAASWLIRATVETDAVAADILGVRTTIKDPLAVEPWSVAINNAATEAYVTNLVSDNLTIIDTADNSFQNVAVGDGPGGTPDGPFGIVAPSGNRIFVTLFGSNTVPSKEFPVDYTTVGEGRVAILTRQANGSFVNSGTINVGKGPRFPAVLGNKLYVPCGGANRVDVIDLTTNQKIDEIAVGVDPSSCTLSLDNRKLYVTNFGAGTVSVINTATDTVIKTIPLSVASVPPAIPLPWNADISPVNGNLYVTIQGVAGQSSVHGNIVEIDTCLDAVLRSITDDSTRGTPPGSAGSTGIPAPEAPLVRDPMTGMTPGAGGGGGGPFGIAACRATGNQAGPSPTLVFTNDGLGLIGVIDSRVDQVVSAPHIIACPKPRDLDCRRIGASDVAYVACGQPDSSVLVINIPALPQNITTAPMVEEVVQTGRLTIRGSGFRLGARIEIVDPVTGACLSFNRSAKVKKNRVLVQKGTLSDGRSIRAVFNSGNPIIIRIINPDGTVIAVLHPDGPGI